MSRAFIGLGSNEGDRLANISRAAKLLGERPGVQLLRMATILESEPIGGPPQGPYLNTVVEIDTTLSARELLSQVKAIEAALGRQPAGQRNAPRPIDLDILLLGETIMAEPNLTIPHLGLHTRWFVLAPLAQLEPGLIHPVLGKTIDALLAAVPRPAGVIHGLEESEA